MSVLHFFYRGWSGRAMMLGTLPVPGFLLISLIIGQEPTVLAVGAGERCLDMFSLVYISLFFLPVSGRQPDTD